MKKMILVFTIIAIFISSYAKTISSDKIPDVIKTNFASDYPDAKVIRWESTDELDYRVEFKIHDNYVAAYYDSFGNFIEDNRTIDWKEIPKTGRMEIYRLGPNKIMNVLKITTNKKEIYYQVALKKNFKKEEVILDEEGHILRRF